MVLKKTLCTFLIDEEDRDTSGKTKDLLERGKGERKYYAESFQILASGPSVKNIRLKWKATYLTHHGDSTSLAAAYKIIVGYSLIMPSLIFHSQKVKKRKSTTGPNSP